MFQAEVAADAIVPAAAHPRRELWVGASTAIIIAANKLAPTEQLAALRGVADKMPVFQIP